MSTITVQAKAPIGDGEWGSPSVLIEWSLDQATRRLTRSAGEFSVTLWIDHRCILGMSDVKDEELPNWANVRVSFVWVEIVVSNVADDLAQFIVDEREAPRKIHHGVAPAAPDYERLKAAYAELGKQVHTALIESQNRFLGFCRALKGQFWVREHPTHFDRVVSFNNRAQASVSLDDKTWHRWCPPLIDVLRVNVADKRKVLAPDDWTLVQKHFSGRGKPALARELMANAEQFADDGEHRSAIVEAICALEVALSDFASLPSDSTTIPVHTRDLVGGASLEHIIDKLGLTGTVSLLLPTVLPPNALTPDQLRTCVEAVQRRQNVVHNGQRSIDGEKVRKEVRAIRELCAVLQQFTRAE